MDWASIVSHFTDARRPVLVVDGHRTLRFVNAPMAELLGYGIDQLLGRSWLSTCVPPADHQAARNLLAQGLSGEASQGELPVVTRAGRGMTLGLGLAREVRGRLRALVIVVNEVRGAREQTHRSEPTGDCWCDVSRVPTERGTVKSLHFLDPTQDPAAFVGMPLGALLQTIESSEVEGSLNAVLDGSASYAEEVRISDTSDAFRVVTANAIDEATVRVKVRCVPVHLLRKLLDAKVARVADVSHLSDRERQVLTLLLRGRGVEDIATMLEIAPRTVKFHQANVLQKVGADSRLDLLRVVL